MPQSCQQKLKLYTEAVLFSTSVASV